MAELEKLLCTDSKVESLKKINAIIDYKELDGKITNCILEVPQNIKLELNNGTLTLKAGSKVIVPNGVDVFEYPPITNDLNMSASGTASNNNVIVYYYDNSLRYTTVGRSGSTDNTSDGLFYNTTENRVRRYATGLTHDGTSLPIAILTMTNGVFTSINQVFNGMGYIGSTVWVDKGVKGLVPNGRNEDGSLKNIEFVTNSVLLDTFKQPESDFWHIVIADYGIRLSHASTTKIWSFDEELNYIKKDGVIRTDISYIGNCNTTNGVITSFQPKLPFRAVDYNDRNLPQVDGQWVRKFASLLVDGTASGGLNSSEGAYSASFDLSNYLPNDKHDYMVTVRIYSQNGTVTNAYNNFCVNGGYGMMSIGKVSGKSVYQDSTIIVPIDSKHTLYIENAPSLGTSIGVNIQLENYRRVGNNN